MTKDGDTIKYTINVRKLYEPGEIITFVREYEDLQVDTTSEAPALVRLREITC